MKTQKNRKRNKLFALLMTGIFCLCLFAGCGQASVDGTEGETALETTTDSETTVDMQTPATDETNEAAVDTTTETDAMEETTSAETDETPLRVGSLKGPTTMGLVELMKRSEEGQTDLNYEFTMETAPDTILGSMMQGNLDIALVPANVAATLYQRSEGAICVIDINTLGVIYLVSGDDSITTMQDLSGKTVYVVGRGTTPDYALQYLLAQNNIDASEFTIEYKSEAAEVAAILAENPDAIGLLPQPFVTAACMQNEALSVVLDMTQEWNAVTEDGSMLVTGVTVVRREYLEEHPGNVLAFMQDHETSATFANTNVPEAAAYVAEYGIVEKAPVAEAAMPNCNITYIDGEEMKLALQGYLNVLYGLNPDSVGGNVPGEDFYYIYE